MGEIVSLKFRSGGCCGTKYHHGLAAAVFRGGFDLFSREIQDYLLRLVLGREMQRAPVNDHLAAADAEESAEVDDCGARRSCLIDPDLYNLAPVLAAAAMHRRTEHALEITVREHRFPGRQRRDVVSAALRKGG